MPERKKYKKDVKKKGKVQKPSIIYITSKKEKRDVKKKRSAGPYRGKSKSNGGYLQY